MSARPGSHAAYARGSDLIVEWYDFGAHAPYESANLLIFAPAAQELLVLAMGLEAVGSPDEIAATLSSRFASYFEVKDFAQERGIPFHHKVDFQP